jgi:hypothetical protein
MGEEAGISYGLCQAICFMIADTEAERKLLLCGF